LVRRELAAFGFGVNFFALDFIEHLVFFEEGFRLIRQHTTTPLAVGEVFNTIWDARLLIEEQLIDYIRTTAVPAGGPTALRRIMDYASVYNVRTACHGADGKGQQPLNAPPLVHSNDWYLLTQLKKFKGSIRGGDPAKDPIGNQMVAMAGTLADEQAMRDVVAYIETLSK